ncbi:hypothetical protein ACWEQL_00590 [Kitasatospora sp. NPDC004240]
MPVAIGHAELLIQLLREARYSAPYVRETIDWIERTAQAGPGSDAGSAGAVVRSIEDYATGVGPGAEEIAQRLVDVRHALALVDHDHYAMVSTVAQTGGEEAVRRVQVLRLAVAAGHARVSSTVGGAVTVATALEQAVFRPVDAGEAHRLWVAARRLREAVRQHAIAVQDLLGRHVRMADWADAQPEWVTVEAKGAQVSVSWWSSNVQAPLGPWVEGGVRDLCRALLEHHGHSVRSAADGALEVLG